MNNVRRRDGLGLRIRPLSGEWNASLLSSYKAGDDQAALWTLLRNLPSIKRSRRKLQKWTMLPAGSLDGWKVS
jgi:hypothetical protein